MDISYRLIERKDALPYLEFFKAVVAETDNLACSLSEAERMSLDDEMLYIDQTLASGSFSVVASSDGIILGSCEMRISSRERLIHRAEMGISVRKEYWGKGVAQSLLDYALKEAEKRGIKKIFLTVRSDNERAKAFYSRNGFFHEGGDSMLFYLNGAYVDGERYGLIIGDKK